ncbi:MAG: adenylate/guanylate cyclase domain-containing protein [Actinomycetota bacterium]
MSLREYLVAEGAPADVIDAAESQGSEALRLLAVDYLLLGAPAYTSTQIAKLAGIDEDTARRYWRALGFADVPDDEVVFTDLDLAALKGALMLTEAGFAKPEVNLQIARVMGHAMSKIADAQVSSIGSRIEQSAQEHGGTADEISEAIVNDTSRLVPINESFLSYMYRRHLAAAAKRTVAGEGSEETGLTLTVGFADMVGFTAITRRLEDQELEALVERFETISYDTIGSLGGRLVKMIGDEVMFVAEQARVAADIAITLAERCAADEILPGLRIGLAHGPLIRRAGDYYGPTVNLANRLAGLVSLEPVLVSWSVRDALREEPAFSIKRSRNRHLKGLGRTSVYSLRRAW